ncbi:MULTISPECIES: exonuclease domain-containing protein [unclassified Paracoccus (in: a-proteobacteria)]|uniref:exonuclease domain-containing protein n=1 Tax=unclassified Paracoccus (in: a-proteobacteria) TaxID=2688777 RepID=UPI0012B284D1|nr:MULTISPECIES: exonuclease domain-containing protein [unclassified Paracoccus (in: a-proteobacteria)]UXU76621.1 exonuclease domain-containing protein [Paracoccus sp. SMMA_5]UXU82509.1 exonuclease domain-containing protein [Paracoccus sp. SMMA_5_TC]
MSFWNWVLKQHVAHTSSKPLQEPNRNSAAAGATQHSPFVLPSKPFRFVALDVETANSSPASICQLGLAFVSDAGEIELQSTFLDCPGPFDAFNVSLHGIGPQQVHGAPTFHAVLSMLGPLLHDSMVVQHSDFDRRAINAACAVAGLEIPKWKWIDSIKLARRAWPEFAGNGGYGLGNLKDALGLEFRHHDAAEDAGAAARVVLHAEAKLQMPLEHLAAPKKRRRVASGAERYPVRD